MTLETIDTIDTYENPKGIVAISTIANATILAYPDKTKGYVRVKSYDAPSNTPLLNGHESQIACLAINHEGTLLATASDKGTIIRIFKIEDGSLVQELRRGAEKAEIYSVCFDSSSKFIACTSDRGTIHIFSLATVNKALNEGNGGHEEREREKEEESVPKNQKSFLGKITKFLKFPKGYWDSEWSFAQFRIPDLKSICTFGQDNTIFVISADGKYYQATFDPRSGGECTKIKEHILHI